LYEKNGCGWCEKTLNAVVRSCRAAGFKTQFKEKGELNE
jgi:hypothetical protein